MKRIVFAIFWIIAASAAFSQEKSVTAFDAKYLNWYNLDPKNDQVMGAGVDKTYRELLTNKKPKKTVTVAVIDGGVDINNEDLKGRIWVNEDEIPGNRIDDDHNGYVDDVNGWNFIGNAKGENITYENYEYVRIFKLGPSDKNFAAAKVLYEKELAKRLRDKELFRKFEIRYNEAKNLVKDKTGVAVGKAEDLKNLSSRDSTVQDAIDFLKDRYALGFTEKGLERSKKRNADFLEKYLNLDFNPRKLIGDDPDDISDKNYGNNDLIGTRASHGTCVSGIIAGIRDNGIGVDGIATDVRIMVIKVVPDGDERDKDVALGIRYAVDNGADIINMSFGKSISPHPEFLSDAIRYAEQKNVLIVHAAGNNAEDNDEIIHYPSEVYTDHTKALNVITVGANGRVKGDSMACFFSNYGREHVDLFAPGEDIVSLDTNMTYSLHSGTSQAAPVVTGVAALILSCYPDLKPKELISLLMESVTDLKKQKVLKPELVNEKSKLVKFGKLSKSGGIVNASNAMKLAQSRK